MRFPEKTSKFVQDLVPRNVLRISFPTVLEPWVFPNCKVLRTENPGSLCACAIGETKHPLPSSVSFHKKDRVGSRTEIDLCTNGLRKAVAMTPSMALLKDMVVHEVKHVFFYAFGTTHGG